MKYDNGRLLFVPLAASLAAALFFARPSEPRKKPPVSGPEFDRAQLMLMNLNRGRDSTGFYLQESHRSSRLMVQELDKAQRQLEQVEKSYARSRGRPDDRFLENAGKSIAAAQATAQKLEQQLASAREELKDSINQVLLGE